MAQGDAAGRERWIRVPVSRRKKSASGLEHLVGAAAASWEAEEEDSGKPLYDGNSGDGSSSRPLDPATLPELEPELEIERLIIPAVAELHSAHIASFSG